MEGQTKAQRLDDLAMKEEVPGRKLSSTLVLFLHPLEGLMTELQLPGSLARSPAAL